MADDAPVPAGTPSTPSPTPQLTPLKAAVLPSAKRVQPGSQGRVVVLLSSTAKSPSTTVQIRPAISPKIVSSAAPVVARPVVAPNPPPLPVRAKAPKPASSEASKSIGRNIPAIKLNHSSIDSASPQESIFVDEDGTELAKPPVGWKQLEPGDLPEVSGDLLTLDVFTNSQKEAKPVSTEVPDSFLVVPEAQETKPPVIPETPSNLIVAPPIAAPAMEAVRTVLPPPVLLSTPPPIEAEEHPEPEHPEKSHALHVVPRLISSEPHAHHEKLRAPGHHPIAHEEERAALHKLGEITEPAPSNKSPLDHPPAPAPLSTEAPEESQPGTPVLRSEPLPEGKTKLASALSESPSIKVEEGKPALRPATLPNKLLKTIEAATQTEPVKKITTLAAAAKAPEPAPEAAPAAPAPAVAPVHATPTAAPVLPSKKKTKVPPTRAEKARRRQIVGLVLFYFVVVLTGGLCYVGGIYFGRETKLEGQVIPPPGMPLSGEVWLVSDFRELAAGIAEDLASDRAPHQQEIQERQDHVQRAQADVALREERARILRSQISAAKAEADAIVKQAREATQSLWDGPGAQLDSDYTSRLNSLQNAIASRAKSLKLNYVTDDTYHSPEVWANAYRLALYQVPKGVDGLKEHQWLSDQMKQWRDFVKTLDTRREELRAKAAQLKLAPAAKLADINTRIEELQHKVDNTLAEQEPIKAELQQAQTAFVQAQSAEQMLDDKYYPQLDALPGENIIKRIPLQSNGRFTWMEDTAFTPDEPEHTYWIFSRATRSDGREYWSLGRFTISKYTTRAVIIEPESFTSTRAVLRPADPDDSQPR